MINSRYFTQNKAPSKPLYKAEYTLPPNVLKGIFSHIPDLYESDLCQASALNDIKVFSLLMHLGAPDCKLLKKAHRLAFERKSHDILQLFQTAQKHFKRINPENIQHAIYLKKQQEDTYHADQEIQRILEEANSSILNEYQKTLQSTIAL